jgi:hypothetical protein
MIYSVSYIHVCIDDKTVPGIHTIRTMYTAPYRKVSFVYSRRCNIHIANTAGDDVDVEDHDERPRPGIADIVVGANTSSVSCARTESTASYHIKRLTRNCNQGYNTNVTA